MKSKLFFCGFLSTFVIALFHLIAYPYLFGAGVGNVSYYILISVLFFSAFFASYFFIEYFKLDIGKRIYTIGSFFLIFFLVWFVSMYFSEYESYYFFESYSLRHRIPFYSYFLILAAFSSIVFIILFKVKRNRKIFRVFLSVFLSMVQAIVLAAPNIINDNGGNLFHVHAYFNPIYNIVRGIPYSDIIASIYGHYPLFYFVPMKILSLFGISMVHSAMIITIAFGFISFLLLYLALARVIKFDGLFIFGAISVSYISFYYYQSGQYYQMLPHRILFPAITFFVISLFINKKIPGWILVLLSSGALLWNFESGIICFIILVIYSVFSNIILEKNRSKKDFLSEILIIAFSLVSPYLLLNICNLLLGGEWMSVKDFIYPIMSNDFEISELAIKIPTLFSLYLLEFSVFMMLLCIYILKLFKKTIKREDLFKACIVIFGLGVFPYYFNRAAYANISIVHIPFVFAICLVFQDLIENEKEKPNLRRKIFAGIPISIILTFFTLGAVSGIPLTIKDRVESSWKMSVYREVCDIIEMCIPPDTAAVGPGLTDIYTSLGWDPQIYIMDWSDWDCSQIKKEYALNEINSKDKILLGDSSGVGAYLKRDEWVIADCLFDAFYYLIRIDSSYESKKDFIIDYSTNNNFSTEDFIDLCFINCYDSFSDEERM